MTKKYIKQKLDFSGNEKEDKEMLHRLVEDMYYLMKKDMPVHTNKYLILLSEGD